jgi:hypothetical protein
MCIINGFTHFVKNGVSVLRRASSGNYEENSPEIEALKREMFSKPSNRHTDMENLRKYRDNVARDVRTAFNNLNYI